MDETIIYKYFAGNATEQEKQTLLNWLHESEDNRMQFCEMKAIWQVRRIPEVRQLTLKRREESLHRLNDRIDVIMHEQDERSIQMIFRWTVGVAATILVLLALTYPLWTGKGIAKAEQPEWITYINTESMDDVDVLTLPDSSKVWLSENARLSYPTCFEGDNRVVRLEGMAFFEIEKDVEHPFVVQTKTCRVVALGTAFSVNTNVGDGMAETVLMNGVVQLTDQAGMNEVKLRPGQQVLYSPENHRIEIHEVDANSLTAWRFGLVTLTNQTLLEIVDQLEKIYHVRIEMNMESVQGRRYNFSFKRSKGPELALSQLSFITGVPARIVP